ncbi:plasmid replication initiator TrfA [Metapseudomonas otitidis]|uniref:plasmid replication initiator TrfA n=1 Tax=Metapseudomonas otitidis TaxID=319939 RepID=UPI002541E564|nr:plasmid replication initiator TrfA [Pseudomonas otitidis]WIF68118.1 plasmid replication initiator TrfA [Pseudomonas otitidis]
MSALAALARLGESLSSRSSALPEVPEDLPSTDLRMESWPDQARGVPNITLRSALFGSSRSTSNTYLQRAEIFCQKPTRMRYTGPRLDQGDLDVWITVLHIARQRKMGTAFKTSAYELLKQQGKTDAGNNRKTLYKRLHRLTAATLEIERPRSTYTGGLIFSFERDELTHELALTLDPKLSKLFGPDEFTHVDWPIRRCLNAKPLAQWLHGFLSSHAEPIPMAVDTIMRMAGSLDASASSREQNFRRALDALQHACELNKQPLSYEILNGIVHIRKTPSASQSRHLERKNSRKRRKPDTVLLARPCRTID